MTACHGLFTHLLSSEILMEISSLTPNTPMMLLLVVMGCHPKHLRIKLFQAKLYLLKGRVYMVLLDHTQHVHTRG